MLYSGDPLAGATAALGLGGGSHGASDGPEAAGAAASSPAALHSPSAIDSSPATARKAPAKTVAGRSLENSLSLIKGSSGAADWLSEHYEACEGGHVAREQLFADYCQAWLDMGWPSAMNAASFGKVIRAVFPGISTRRLGTRGNSKYHYYGIKSKADAGDFSSPRPSPVKQQLKKSSSSSSTTTTKRNRGNAKSIDNNQQMRENNMNANIDEDGGAFIDDWSASRGSLPVELDGLMRFTLPDFSKLNVNVTVERAKEFLSVYRDHNEATLKSGLAGAFDATSAAIMDFWKGLPDAYLDLFLCQEMCRTVAEWDTVVYQALLTVFLPDILGPCDQANLRELKTFAKSLPAMLNMAFDGKPMVELVLAEKARVSMEFGRIVKQYYHLNHLAMQAHDIFQQQPEIVDIMAAEWRALEFDGIVAQSIYMCPNAHEVLCLVQDNVHHRLSIKATVNQWAEWVYAMAEEFMTNDTNNLEEYIFQAQQYLIKWNFIGSLILRDLGERNKDTFTPFHVLRLFCDEYIRYLVDCKIDEKRRQIEALTAASGALQQQHLMEQHVGHDQHSLHQQLHHQHDSMAVNAWPGSSQTPVGFDMFGGTSAGSNGAYLADMGHDFYRPQSSTLRGGYHAVAVVTPDVAQGMPSAGLAHYPMSSALTANDALGEESAHLNLDMADKAFAQAIGGELTHTEESVEQQ